MTAHTVEDIEAEAAAWVIRLADPDGTDAARAEFRDWLDGGAERREAFEIAERTWGELGLLATAAGPKARRLPRALAVAALAAGLSLWIWQDDLRIRLLADYVAPIGENMSVTLEDGSRVELASGAALAVDYDGDQRRLRLLEGRAYFTVAPMEQSGGRPFMVEAGGLRATALGTQFAVDLQHETTEVLVTEHSVGVAPVNDPGRAVVVPEGMAVDYAQGSITPPAAVNGDFATAWRSGELVFDDRPLGEVVRELNRYRHGRIVVRGDLAARRVSGVFHTSDIGQSVERIAAELGLRRLSLPPLITVLY